QKLVRDRDQDLAESFHAAFVVECLCGLAGVLIACAIASVLWLASGRARLPLTTVLLATLCLQSVAELPASLLHRRMDFAAVARLRIVASVAGIGVTIATALLGLGLWALVIGQAAFVAATASLCWRGIELPASRRFGRSDVESYLRFGAPFWGLGVGFTTMERGGVLAISSILGVTILGYVHLAHGLTARLFQMNEAINGGIYPSLRGAQASPEALRRLIEQGNRLLAALALPIGIGLALFANDWVPLVFGARWLEAAPFVSVYCLFYGLGTIGYSSHLAFQVHGDTRPLLVFGTIAHLGRLAVLVAAMLWWGVEGLLSAVLLGIWIDVGARTLLFRRMFPRASLLRPVAGVVIVSAAAALLTAAIAAALPAMAGLPQRAAVFAGMVLVGTLVFERDLASLLQNALGYRRGRAAARSEAADGGLERRKVTS
ncbi:MAG: oligosaccharide flippase family protein, partial [Candidatus Binatia bacterium]